MNEVILYQREDHPFGDAWEKWAATWCSWMLSIPRQYNPTIDTTGEFCHINQPNENVWFLTGTFGNIDPVTRKCTIPSNRSLLFPILEKEDSLIEDTDLSDVSELIIRCKESMDKCILLKASVDDVEIEDIIKYRVLSEPFNLVFPGENVYGVKAGPTISVCDGYWIFIKPLNKGRHRISFKGESLLEDDAVLLQLKSDHAYNNIWGHISKNSTFRLEVNYDVMIDDI